MKRFGRLLPILGLFALASCGDVQDDPTADARLDSPEAFEERLAQYATVRFEPDLSHLSDTEKHLAGMLSLAIAHMDSAFWKQAYGIAAPLLRNLDDPDLRLLAELNFGPWDRLRDDEPFLAEVGPKPVGANFFPRNLTSAELETQVKLDSDMGQALTHRLTIVRRDGSGALVPFPYDVAFWDEYVAAAVPLREAASVASSFDQGFQRYLEYSADGLLTSNYGPSQAAWLDMVNSPLDLVIGPVWAGEERLLGHKAVNMGMVLVNQPEWTDRLRRYAASLPEIQNSLPVAEPLRRGRPGIDAAVGAYDVVSYAGAARTGATTMALRLPWTADGWPESRTRQFNLRNAQRGVFDLAVSPIASNLLPPDQSALVTFDAFFTNNFARGVSRGLGVRNPIGSDSTVQVALGEHHEAIDALKAHVLGLHVVTWLSDRGRLSGESLDAHYTTFLASLFHSLRGGFGRADAVAGRVLFRFFEQQGAFVAEGESGLWRVDFARMRDAIAGLSEVVLTVQGQGDRSGAAGLLATGTTTPELQRALDLLTQEGVPVSVRMESPPQLLPEG